MFIAGLVLATAATINMAGAWLKGKPEIADPYSELKKILAEIDTGEEVTLVPDTGLPRWYSKENNPVVFQASRYNDNSCTINSIGETFFELLREQDLPENYLFRADVRHEFAADVASRAGFYFGKFDLSDTTGLKCSFFNLLEFSDHLRIHFGDIQNKIILSPSCIRSTPGTLSKSISNPLTDKHIDNPPITSDRTWRRLEIIVGKDAIKFESAKQNSNKTQIKKYESNKVLCLLSDASDQKISIVELSNRRATSTFSGSIGLYNTQGIANFRNVTIQKIITD